MSNQERIQARIARDKARKAAKRQAAVEKHGTYENVITLQNLHRSLRKRRKNVEWKGSVQSYLAHAIVKIKRSKDELLRGEVNINRAIKRMTIYERGKRRDIHAIMIDSRVIQGVLCDASITPLTQPSLIYDNPASTKHKGISHARNRILKMLREQIKRSGPNSYALLTDYTGFFDSIPHAVCKEKLKKAGMDDRLCDLTMSYIKMYQAQDYSFIEDPVEREQMYIKLANDEDSGATLGSQISQDMALVVPNDVDHAVKDRCGMKGYIRYMDDSYTGHGDKQVLQAVYDVIKQESNAIGLKLNEKKTHIVKFTRGFMFLKVHYIVTDTGKIIKKMAKAGIVRMRRKLKKFVRLVQQGKMRMDDVFNSFNSWRGNAKKYSQSYRARKAMLVLYNKLFKRYRTGGIAA